MPSNIPIYVVGGDNVTEPPATIKVYSPAGTEETAYLQPGWDYAAGKHRLTYMVKRGWGRYLLEQFVAGQRYAAGFYMYDQSAAKSGRVYDTVTLAFSDTLSLNYPGNAAQTAAYQTTYTARTSTAEVPLETLPNYLTKWNYDLYGWWNGDPMTTDPPTPSWWDTATDLSDASGIPEDGGYLWSKTTPAEPEEGYWVLIEPRTKSGVETALRVRPCVVETKFFGSRNAAMNALKNVGQRQSPDEYDDLADDWLITDCNVNEQNGYYSTVTEYTGAKSWDTDLYQQDE